MKQNVSLNLGLHNQTAFSKEDAALFLIVLGKTCAALSCTPLEIVGDVSKDNWITWHNYLRVEGFKGNADEFYEQGCGLLFGMWP